MKEDRRWERRRRSRGGEEKVGVDATGRIEGGGWEDQRVGRKMRGSKRRRRRWERRREEEGRRMGG